MLISGKMSTGMRSVTPMPSRHTRISSATTVYGCLSTKATSDMNELPREGHVEAAAAAQGAHDAHCGAVRIADRLDDGKAEPGSAGVGGTRCIDPVEAFKHMRQRLGRNADTAVLHGKHLAAFSYGDAQMHGAVGRRVLDGIVEQVDHDLPQARSVPCNHHALLSLASHGNALVRGQQQHLIRRARDECAQMDRT